MLAGFYLNITKQDNKEILIKRHFSKQSNETVQRNLKGPQARTETERPKEGLSLLIGKNVGSLEQELGKPRRIDPTIYGYDWYIYNQNPKRYLQVGVEDNLVVTIYAIGKDLNIAPFEIGQPVEEIFNTQYIDANVNIDIDGGSYRFELNDTDINLRPLIKLGDLYAQLYFDKFSGELSSVRFLNAETLVKLKPYELVYQGKLIEPPTPDEVLWKNGDSGNEQELFDLTNVLRVRNGLKPLLWDEKVAAAAFEHSKDMFETNDFTDSSSRYGSLSERLKSGNVSYQLSGENSAANYTDGPEAAASWLNSQSHREALLNKKFSHIGIGVYQKYYTQDFIKKIK